MSIEIKKVDVECADAQKMIKELGQVLTVITGKDGSQHYDPRDLQKPRAVFTVAYCDGEPAGCGGIREYDRDTAELKRLYAKPRGCGIGRVLLEYLERSAVELGYTRLLVQTKGVNENAVAFYTRMGYTRCESFGVYRDMPEAVCFEKALSGLRIDVACPAARAAQRV